MSNLSAAECTAGISRRALESLTRKTVLDRIISEFRCTHVIDTPMRRLDLVQSNSGEMYLRNVEFDGNRVGVVNIHLGYHEAQALADVLRSLEPPADDDQPKNGKARR